MRPDHYALLFEFIKWAGEQPFIDGIALIGASALDEETDEEATLNFLIITEKKTRIVDAILKQFQFDAMEQATREEWGLLTSLRIEYASGVEAEFGIVGEQWIKEPLEQETIDAIAKGFKVLWEQDDLFSGIKRFVAAQ